MLTLAATVTIAVLSMFIAYVLGRVSQWIADTVQPKSRVPYWLRGGLDDLSAIDTDVLLWIRDALMIVEGRLQDQHRLVGQIRRGDYDQEQAAAPRRERAGSRGDSRAADLGEQ
ncbi:MAG TPA: hypothetical protein DCP69_02610 [Candidatus Omnitrophica bacterium]|nr:hypothetical protein [Candidatus Omnitrophota bacterium]